MELSPSGIRRSGWLAAVSLGFLVPTGLTQERASTPSGYQRFDCPGGADTPVSVPFQRTPRWRGPLLGSPTDLGGDQTRLDLSGSPGFADGSLLDPPHHLLTTDAAGAPGRVYAISGHTANSVTVRGMRGEDRSALAMNDLVQIVPAWTLDALFPKDSQTTFHPSPGNLLSQRGSELLRFDTVSAGTGLAPARRYFITPSGWIEAGSYAAAGATVIAPGEAFLVRHPAGRPGTSFFAHQEVFAEAFSVFVRVRAAGFQDTVFALPRPVPVSLTELAVPALIVQDSPDTQPGNRRDELHVFDSLSAGFHKPPSAIYFRVAGNWVRDAPGFPAASGDLLQPSQGLLLRKASGQTDETLLWLNDPTYDVSAP